ncbi:sulfatase-like hydrolase/transferase [Pontiella agarivorans]|nr:sulfatase-like hydrolase/transferase [Pontiella agarivorans]
MKKILLRSVATAVLAAASGSFASTRPNIIMFLVDDLGWNHISSPAATLGNVHEVVHTPHIAQLAENGLSFTHAYASPNCAPTRAAMLTGQYSARKNNQVYAVLSLNRYDRKGGVTEEQAKFRGPEQTMDVAVEAVTVAEALKKNGYTTAHLGKYHCGGHDSQDTMPENAGFDINVGGWKKGHHNACFAKKKGDKWAFGNLGLGAFTPYAAPYDQAYVREHGFPDSLIGTPKHVSDAVGDAMEDTIEKLAAGANPFYFQFHTFAVHGPLGARPDLKAAARARLGADADDEAVEYSGFLSSVDLNLKRLLAAVNDPNGDGDTSDSIKDNTLILFSSDNGAAFQGAAPLRGHKGMFTEGGLRVPLIAYWPGKIAAGTVTDRMVYSTDFYPTYLDLAGATWRPDPATHPLDGESFAEVLMNPTLKKNREPIYYLFPGYLDKKRATPCVVTLDQVGGKRYKLFYFYETNSRELYCLSDDIGEEKDIFAENPEIVSVLARKTDAWLRQQDSTWKPVFPIHKKTGKSAGPPPVL